jgi:hypothetical protein
MHTKYKHLKVFFLAALLLSSAVAFGYPAKTFAACTVEIPGDCQTAEECEGKGQWTRNSTLDGGSCLPLPGGAGNSDQLVQEAKPDPAIDGDCSNPDLKECSLIKQYINPLIALLAAFVGVAVTISIALGGIQYASSAGDPQKAAAAKDRIRNAIIALLTFLFLLALLTFIVPGGLF